MKKKALIIGAGAIGLGFLAERMSPDYDICLVDIPARGELLRRVQENQGLVVNVCSLGGISPVRVSCDFETVVSGGQDGGGKFLQALREADLVLTATNRKHLDGIVANIAPAMNSRTKTGWLLFCENGLDIAKTYSGSFSAQVTSVDTVMSRMCRFTAGDEADYAPMWPDYDASLVVEDYGYLPLDADLCAGGPFSSAFSMVTHEEFLYWEDVKLYLHNGMHAFVSYHAFLEGVRLLRDAPVWVREQAREVMLREVVPAIVSTHPAADRNEVQRYGLELLERFFSPYFNDSVERGTRGIEDKLAPDERLLGGCEYIRRAGIDPKGYASTIEAARRIQSTRQTLGELGG